MDYHKKVSYLKSALRIVGLCFLPFHIVWGVVGLVVAELLGIAEEF